MKLTDLSKRLDELIQKGEAVVATGRKVNLGIYRRQSLGYEYQVDEAEFTNFNSSSLSFLQMTFGIEHPYYLDFAMKAQRNVVIDTKNGISILKAAKEEISGGWLFTTKGLASADIFSDFLEMASYLLSEQYKDAAAVIIGSTLESHLRQLCQKYTIPIQKDRRGKASPVKTDSLNIDLRKTGVYDLADQKQVTAWLDLRNSAAHGNYLSYSQSQIEIMLQGVQDFILRNSL